MDDFREWLSDNLRYFMLGGAILLIVAVLFFSIRACTGGKKGSSGDQQQSAAQDDKGTVSSSPANNGETDGKKKDANPMEKDDAEVSALIKSYYKALGEKDIATLRTLVDNLSPSDESKITNAKDYIEGYDVGDVYTKKGLSEGTYVAYVCFDFICKDITTHVPALSQLYVITSGDGNLKIDGAWENDAQISAFADAQQSDADVQELYSSVKKKNEDAQAGDPALAEFLTGLGEDAGNASSTANGAAMTVTEGCNVRDMPDGEIIGGLEAGTEVEKLGQDGEWIQIDYDGETGYVHSSLLE